jgi:hypothetical protein
MQNTSPDWLPCIDSDISNTVFCQGLPPNLFDIEVLDDQDTQIQEFEGSTAGTTIQNLQPGTYSVNEIKVPPGGPIPRDQLLENATVEDCENAGFSDGGSLLSSTGPNYRICFEYKDIQGNDCGTITLAAGEERTCIVKNYIRFGSTER